MLQIKNLNKSFGEHKVLSDVNLTFEKGRIYGIIGINGSGKSTLFRTMSGIYKPTNGEVLLDGNVIYDNPITKKDIIYIPDENPFFYTKNIKELIEFYEKVYGKKDEELYQKALKIFNLDINKNIKSFSKGMKKQAILLSILPFKPRFILLDETFEGVDPVIRRKIKGFLIEEVDEKEMTIIVSTHNIGDLENLCDEIIVFNEDKVEENSLQDNLYKIQVAFSKEVLLEGNKKVKVMNSSKIGSVYNVIVQGEIKDIEQYFNGYEPIVFDVIPFSIEETFIYTIEQGGK